MLKQEVIETATRPSAATRRRDPIVPWLIGAMVVLVAIVLALGTMLVAPLISTSPTTEQIDRNIAAWNVFDEQTLRSVYTDDAFIFASSESDPSASGIDEVVSLARWGGFSIERLGPVTERWSLVWYPVHISTQYDVEGDIAVVVMELRDGRIAQHWVIWGTDSGR